MEKIKIKQYESILSVTLNEPEKNNPLSDTLCKELIETLRKAESNPTIRAIVLTGAGKSFCAGADIAEFSSHLDQSSMTVYQQGKSSTGELFQLGANYSKPIIGAVNGYALAGGFGLTCLCHVVFASELAKFGITEINIGLFPMVILPVVRKVIGERKTLELSLTAEIFDAQKALELGVVNYVVPHDQLKDEVLNFAQKIAERSPVAVQMGLTSYNETYLMDTEKAVKYLNSLRVINFKSKDLNEGANAFLEKRKPVWSGE